MRELVDFRPLVTIAMSEGWSGSPTVTATAPLLRDVELAAGIGTVELAPVRPVATSRIEPSSPTRSILLVPRSSI